MLVTIFLFLYECLFTFYFCLVWSTSEGIPITLLNYVKRSLKTVVLDDATAQSGLSSDIARQIVEETHNGGLSCNSVLGEGTEFVIEIPVF
ncbi:MAG: ATP-binding protein [Nostoc sp.]|uniref:ATP-binding protein n=1 Tax=Nostoc sp. TaxID=1180 RepID=UPI002FFBBDE1